MRNRKSLQVELKVNPTPSPAAKFALLGQLIQTYRSQAGLDYQQLSEISEVPIKELHELETGQMNPSLSRLYAICNVLNIPPSEVESIFVKMNETRTSGRKKRSSRVI